MAIDEVHCAIGQEIQLVLVFRMSERRIGFKIKVLAFGNNRFIESTHRRMILLPWPKCHLPNMPVAYPVSRNFVETVRAQVASV